MSDNKDISPEMAAKIAAIKARMKGGAEGGGADESKAEAEGKPAEEAKDSGGGDAPAGDKAAQIAAIKARLAGGKSASGGGGGESAAKKKEEASGGDDDSGGGGDDMQSRIAALKAKMDTGKGKEAEGAAAKTASKPAAKKGGGKNVYPVQPINKKGFGDERLYGDATVSKWFILSGLVLLVSVIMMWDRDWDRQWKAFQKRHRQREIQRLEMQIAEAEEAVDDATLEQVEASLAAAEAELESHGDREEELQEEVDELDGIYYAANQQFQIAKSEFDAMRYEFEELRLDHGDDESLLEESQEELDAQAAEVAELRLAADNAKLALDEAKNELAALEDEVKTLTREKEGLLEDKLRLESTLAKIGPGLFNDFIRNAPVVDMLAPTLKVEKIVVEDLHDNYNFMYVDKVDMCITCHVSIADPYYSEWDPDNSKRDVIPGERVLNAHPRLDLFVSDTSPHPMGEFGCTVCHQGRGQAVEFERTFHTPAADAYETEAEKEERWVRDFGYDPERHYWDWPMTPANKLYSSCYMCHTSTDRIAGVPEYNESRALVETLGCYGCHKIEGFEHLRKVGPDLTNIAGKTTEEWAQKWSMGPRDFRPTTNMPHFWDLSNVGGPGDPRQTKGRRLDNKSDRFVDDWPARNEVEARAVVAYVFEQSRQAMASGDWEPMTPPDREGDVAAGYELFQARGCLGCHSVEAEGWTENGHGPDLSAVGSKVDADWLYSWLMDPKSYYQTTVMPDLRLSEDEAWDITAWLLSMKDEDWAAQPPPAADAGILGDIAVEYLASVAGDDWAKEEVAAMRAEGGDAAVELFVGGKLFNRYGCSGCHLVPGHYDDVGIGTELTYESLKELSKFDFGHEAAHGNPEAVEHSREAFYRHKMIDPRVYDRMPIVITDGDGNATISHYDQKVKLPGEKLKMPDFGLDDREVELLTQFLLGLRADGIDETMMHTLGPAEQVVEQGSRLITKYNCIGCHRMGQLPVPLSLEGEDLDAHLTMLEDAVEEGLEYGLWMAEPVEVDGITLYHEGDWLSDEYYDPEWEESSDVFEFFEEDPENRPVPDRLMVYGHGEGGMGNYIDDAAMRPPVFRGQGAKVNPDWVFEFLIEPYTVRNHVQVRMPTFGLTPDESMALVRWFSERDDQPWPFERDMDTVLDEDLYRTGEAIFNEFQCNQCHPAGDVLPTQSIENWGPDLGLTSERLKMTWVHDWLQDPQQIQPGTRMPNFFGEFVDNEYESYYDDWSERIEALQHYLKHLGKLPPAESAEG